MTQKPFSSAGQRCGKEQQNLIWPAIILIVLTGLIHLVKAPGELEEAAYKGWLFYANAAGAVVAAYGIYKRKCWGWNLGLLIAVGSIAGYVASRTVGLPMIPAEPDAWLKPMGVASLIVEVAFVGIVFIVHRKAHGTCCQKG